MSGIHRCVALAIENASVEVTRYIVIKVTGNKMKMLEEYSWGLCDFIEIFMSDFVVKNE